MIVEDLNNCAIFSNCYHLSLLCLLVITIVLNKSLVIDDHYYEECDSLMQEGTRSVHLASAPQRRLKLPFNWKPGTQWYSATAPKTVVSFTRKMRALATSSG